MEIYRVLADVVFWFHWAWLALLLGGIVLSSNYKWYWPYHWCVILSTIISQIVFFPNCPLVLLENVLRAQYDPKTTYTGSFICHYLDKHFGFQMMPWHITLVLLGITLFSAFIFLRRSKK